MKRVLWAIPVLAIVAIWVMSVSAAGLSVSFLNPPAGNWPAGLDFATDVLGDAWDMNSMNDISIDPLQRTGWSSIGVNGGTGVPNAIGGAYVGPGGMTVLYQGHYNVINTHRNGRQSPIDTNLFRRLAFKLKTQNADAPIVWWFHRPYSHPSGEGIGGGTGFLVSAPNTYQITTVNLSSIPGANGEPWTLAPTAVGLRIDPRPGSGAAENIFFDWVRLTAQDDGASSAMQTVQWSPAGAATVSVTDSNGTSFNVACAFSNSTSCRWNYGILPPGNYSVHVQQGGNFNDVPFTVNATPSVQITSPSMTSGEDYATAKQLNPWDMNDPADIDNDWIGSDHITESWPGTELIATSDGVCASDCGTQPTGDPEIYMLANNEPGINRGTIDSSKYRYLTLTMQIDHAYDLFAGSVGRILFGHVATFQNGISPHYNLAVSEAFLAWPGNVSYSIDLGALGVGTDQGIEPGSPAPLPWNQGTIRQLRIDPHEFAQVVDTHLSDVKLTAMSEVAPGNNFTVGFSASDPDGGSPSVHLYRDTDKNPSSGLVEITTSPLSGQTSYNWNTSGVPVGNYYIYALVSDGINAFGRYSEAPVHVGLPASGPPDPLLFFNSPAPGATTGTSFGVTGWAIDRGAGVGTGIDQVHVYAYPAGGGAPIALGVATYGIARSDVAAAYGAQFTNSGFSLNASGLATGSYQITAFGHSTVTGTFNVNASVAINVSGPVPHPAIALGAPMSNSTSGSTVTINGWAVDTGAPSGTGVNLIHVYAFPSGGGSPTFLGAATYGSPRSDIAAIYGPQFTNSGFSLQVPVAPGSYTFVAYMRSTVTNTFNASASSANVTVNSTNSNPTMLLDGPPNGATRTRPFVISGWAVDTGAASGTGINAIHIWAFPTNGSPQFFVGVGTYGTSRPDVGTYLGDSRYNNSGFTFTVTSGNMPSPGTYDFQVFGRSTVTGGFTVARVVRVTVN